MPNYVTWIVVALVASFLVAVRIWGDQEDED